MRESEIERHMGPPLKKKLVGKDRAFLACVSPAHRLPACSRLSLEARLKGEVVGRGKAMIFSPGSEQLQVSVAGDRRG